MFGSFAKSFASNLSDARLPFFFLVLRLLNSDFESCFGRWFYIFFFLGTKEAMLPFGSPELYFGNRKLRSPSITQLVSRN